MTRKDVRNAGSPVFHIPIANIADGAFQQVDLMQETSQYAKYAPYDFIEVYNNSILTLELTLNDIHRFPIPGSVDMVKSDLMFTRFRIINNSGALLTGTDLFISVQHTPITEDKALREPESLTKKLLGAVPLLGLMR